MIALRRLVGVTLAGLTLGVGFAAPAFADGLQVDGPDAGLHFDRLAPGYSKSAALEIENGSEGAATLHLQSLDVTNVENGCLRQETRSGDVSCGAGDAGELGDWLDVTVSREGQVLWAGPAGDLSAGADLDGVIPAGETWTLDVEVGMPAAAGNDTMTDAIAFDLRWTATGETGETDTELQGVQAGAGSGSSPGSGSSGVSVPIAVDAGLGALVAIGEAGLHSSPLVLVAGLLVLVGIVLGWRRRRRGPLAPARHAARP